MKNIFSVFFFLLLFSSIEAQEYKHLDLFTRKKIIDGEYSKTDINLFVKGNLDDIKQAVVKCKGTYKYGYNNVASVNIPINRIDLFAEQKGVLYIENGDVPVVSLGRNDQALILNNINPIHIGQSPLTRSYKGDGIIVGFIDDGIDFRHADFMNDDSSTRILYLWDQRASNINIPIPYTYGREWSAAEIDAGICTHVEPANKFGHGSTVSGIAVGNGKATGNYVGIAPESEVIFVAINSDANFLSRIADGVDYIFKKADALGKPCVINISYGTYFGSRDGKDLASELIDNLLEERCGRVVVAAAGNAGNNNYHLGYNVTSDTSFTWLKKIPTDVDLYWALWADTADFKNVRFAFGCDSIQDTINTFRGRTNFIDIPTYYNLIPGTVDVADAFFDLQDTAGNSLGTIRTRATHTNGRYQYEVIIQPEVASNLWRFITTGNGKFDIWSSFPLMNTSDMVKDFAGIDTSKTPGINFYKFPDNQKTMVSSFQNSDKVITVANYNNNAWYLNGCDDTTFTGVISGQKADDSSLGPTRDLRQKPDIAATGAFTIATGNLANMSALFGSGQCERVAEDSLHQRNGGTSMASPCVTGAVALLLQQNPDACWYEIKDRIINTAVKDSFTGNNLPNEKWGYGKLNAFDAFFLNSVYGCTDTASLNYNPNAQFDDGSCIAAIKGCLDPNALNFNELANVADTCKYYVFNSVDELKDNIVQVYPSPAKDKVTIQYKVDNIENTQFLITDVLGSEIELINITNNEGLYSLNISKYAKGVYFLRILNYNHTLYCSKFYKY